MARLSASPLILACLFAAVVMLGGPFVEAASAYDPAGAPLPPGATLAQTYEFVDGGWIYSNNAISYNSGFADGSCNKQCWDLTVQNNVSVAQWLDWEIAGTRTDWRVLKPGQFTGMTMNAQVRSNNTIHVRMWFNDLVDQQLGSVAADIEHSFSVTASDSLFEAETFGWKRAVDHPASDPFLLVIPDGPSLRNGTQVNLWQQVHVTSSHPSSEYYGEGGLLICLTNMKYWVDSELGGFDLEHNPGLVTLPQFAG